MPIFALCDANNFYCSWERVFNPALRGIPVVVLSNNDGCCIARSQEAKDLGIKMGDPGSKSRSGQPGRGCATTVPTTFFTAT
jgi:DNA polymerase V